MAPTMPLTRAEAPIATPCGENWTKMTPRGKARLCGTCDKLVHDLSGMDEGEARALLGAPPNEGLCIRYLHDIHGNIWFQGANSDRLVPSGRLARGSSAMLAAAALVFAPVLTEACGGAGPDGNPTYSPASTIDASPQTQAETDAHEPDAHVPPRVQVGPSRAEHDGGAEAGLSDSEPASASHPDRDGAANSLADAGPSQD